MCWVLSVVLFLRWHCQHQTFYFDWFLRQRIFSLGPCGRCTELLIRMLLNQWFVQPHTCSQAVLHAGPGSHPPCSLSIADSAFSLFQSCRSYQISATQFFQIPLILARTGTQLHLDSIHRSCRLLPSAFQLQHSDYWMLWSASYFSPSWMYWNST